MGAGSGGARRTWRYLVLVVGWSWAFWLVAVALGRSANDSATFALIVAGAAGVPGLAIAFLCADGNRTAWYDYWHRLADPRRLGWRGTLIVMLPLRWLWLRRDSPCRRTIHLLLLHFCGCQWSHR